MQTYFGTDPTPIINYTPQTIDDVYHFFFIYDSIAVVVVFFDELNHVERILISLIIKIS